MNYSIDTAARDRLKRSVLAGLAVLAVAAAFVLGWHWIVGTDEPKDERRITVGKYMNAIRTKDIDTAQSLLCSELAKNPTDVQERAQRFRKLDYKIGKSIKKSETEYQVNVGVNAVVNLAGTDTPSRTTYIFKVVKEEDQWRVCGITT